MAMVGNMFALDVLETFIHTDTHKHIHIIYIYTYIGTYIHTYMHAYIHTYMQKDEQTDRQTDRPGGYRPFCGGTVRFAGVPSVLTKRTVPRGGTVHFGKTDGTRVKWTVPSWNRVFPLKVASREGSRGAPAGSCPRTPPRKAPKGRRRNPI